MIIYGNSCVNFKRYCQKQKDGSRRLQPAKEGETQIKDLLDYEECRLKPATIGRKTERLLKINFKKEGGDIEREKM